MYNAPRAATCIAQTDCKLWSLDRNSFRVIVVAAAMQKRETYSGFLAKVPILQSLTETEIMALADVLQEEDYEDGALVCKQGEDGNYFYIIKDGIANCSQTSSDGVDHVVATLTAGNYFGGESTCTSMTLLPMLNLRLKLKDILFSILYRNSAADEEASSSHCESLRRP